jgi:hypothetical protein
MTDLHDHQPLSRVELMVLARLSVPKAPTKADIATSLSQIGMPFAGAALADCVLATLTALEGHALIAVLTAPPSSSRKHAPVKSSGKRRKPSKPSSTPRFALTDSGRFALCDAFDLEVAPTWKQARDSVVPALALGVHPGSKAANTALRSTEAMTATLLRRERVLGEPVTVNQLCDQVIARALGMPPGPVTPAGIRAYVLAMHCGVEGKAEFERISASFAPTRAARSTKKYDDELKTLAAGFARKQLHANFKTKASMVQALQRHWMSQHDETDDAHQLSPAWSNPLPPSQRTSPEDLPSSAASHLLPLLAVAADTLLTAVREAIPMIGSNGRYGKDNVFVSALWQHLARDRRLPDLSLDRFKRWLVAANRDQLLDLARADLVDAMDSRLVEESEIEDLGATFHFVVDRREISSGREQVDHAR